MMTRRSLIFAVTVLAVVVGATRLAAAQDRMGAHLSSVQEVPPVRTEAHGFALVAIDYTAEVITYSVVYFALESHATQAHIHFGTPGVNGAIVAFLCTNLPNTPVGLQVQACPNGPGFNTISGTLTAADVVGVPAQGIAAGNWSALAEIIENSASYVNVHTEAFPGGEIRGPISH